ncbi:MAG: transglutaminase-like domain-containing protein [Bacillota bacterium]|nr:transglutaminase-like domain-containing protein [Bacillota bacterium]
MKLSRWTAWILVVVLAISAIPGFAADDSANKSIDTSSLDQGIIRITHKANNELFRVLVKLGDKQVTYPYVANGVPETFPLQFGNGEYTVGLLRNVSGTKFAFVEQTKVKLDLKDPNIVYLNSIQNIKWDPKDQPIVFGGTLIKDLKNAETAAKAVHTYMTENIVYDWDKIATLKKDYVPSITKTFVDSRGICYDYSSLLAAFLRSQGYPTRLVKGYTKFVEGYHAWNEVLIDGKWMIIDSTVDASLKDFKSIFKKAEDYTKVNDY